MKAFLNNILISLNQLLEAMYYGFIVGVGIFTAFYTFVALYGWAK